MPACRKCGKTHFNFEKCETARVRQPVQVRFQPGGPDGYTPSTGWGRNVNNTTIYRMNPRTRTGSLIPPTEPEPPEAA